MKRVTRDRIYFCEVCETHRRTIFTEDNKFFVKWRGGYVEVDNNKNYWRTKDESIIHRTTRTDLQSV